MEELFKELAAHIALAIEAVAILAVAIGSIEAVISAVRGMFSGATTAEMREVWMRYARWLVAGLTSSSRATSCTRRLVHDAGIS